MEYDLKSSLEQTTQFKITEKNVTLWWMYINNKKIINPIEADDVEKYCDKFYKSHSEMLQKILMKGFTLTFPEGKVRLKKYKNKIN